MVVIINIVLLTETIYIYFSSGNIICAFHTIQLKISLTKIKRFITRVVCIYLTPFVSVINSLSHSNGKMWFSSDCKWAISEC